MSFEFLGKLGVTCSESYMLLNTTLVRQCEEKCGITSFREMLQHIFTYKISQVAFLNAAYIGRLQKYHLNIM